MSIKPIHQDTHSQGLFLSNPFHTVKAEVASRTSGIVAAGAPIFGYDGSAATHINEGIFAGKLITHLSDLKAPQWDKIPAFLINLAKTLIKIGATFGKYMGRFNPKYLPYWNLVHTTFELYEKGKALIHANAALKKATNAKEEKMAYLQLASATASLGSSIAKCAMACYSVPWQNAKFALYAIAQASALYELHIAHTSNSFQPKEGIELDSFGPTEDASFNEDTPLTAQPFEAEEGSSSFFSFFWRGPLGN